jgi:hypothetical protein
MIKPKSNPAITIGIHRQQLNLPCFPTKKSVGEELIVFNTHGQMSDMLSYQNYDVHAWLRLTRATAFTAVFQRAVENRARVVTVPSRTPENPQRNGHGTRGTAAVEPWARAAALLPPRTTALHYFTSVY